MTGERHSKEHWSRSFVKTVIFRAIVMSMDFTSTLIISGKLESAISFVGVSNIYSTVTYYVYERLWNRTDWRKHKPNGMSEEKHSKEHWTRSLIKTIIYRIVIMSMDFISTYLITGRVEASLEFMVVSNIYTTVTYYVYERLWNRTGWRKHKP